MRMIYHVPYPIDLAATSASGIRPARMLKAFTDIGLDVTLVSGYTAERKNSIEAVLRGLRSGDRYDFVYSESSTMPTAMTDPHHLPLRPFMDFKLLRAARRTGARVGLFYRDVYWMFPEYAAAIPLHKRLPAVASYRWDLAQYRTSIDVMYLPSLGMAAHIGAAPYEFKALPPAHSIARPVNISPSPLRLFYVGGLGAHYRLHALVEAMRLVPEARLTICTREAEWRAEGPGYQPLPDNVEVVHKVGDAALAPIYAKSNLGVLTTPPGGYFAFAVPYKLYEYIGYGLPIIGTRGSLTGETVESRGLGWTIEHSPAAIATLLQRLAANPSELSEAHERVLADREDNTWPRRAMQVRADLTS